MNDAQWVRDAKIYNRYTQHKDNAAYQDQHISYEDALGEAIGMSHEDMLIAKEDAEFWNELDDCIPKKVEAPVDAGAPVNKSNSISSLI
jgi:hypothetical protein